MKMHHFSKSLQTILVLLVFSAVVFSLFGRSAGRAQAKVSDAPVEITWFIGLGTGADPSQIPAEQQVVDDFNTAHPDIHLNVEIVPSSNSREVLWAEIANGQAPDLVGPLGWISSNQFHGEWLDLAPLITSTGFDTSIFDPTLLNMYNTPDEGQVALPFAIYPSALYYNPALFDAAGLSYPPTHYGDQWEMPDHTMVPWDWAYMKYAAQLLTLDNTGKNSTQTGFDATHIVQYGFSFGWESNPNYWGSYWQAGSLLHGTEGSYYAQIPDIWKAAWQWVYDGIWGASPFIPSGPVSNSPDFDIGNVFASGKVAMLENPAWYLCCMYNLTSAGGTFQFGAMPSYYNGAFTSGRIDADSFRIPKASAHPDEAFTVLTYLVTTGVDKLIIGSDTQPPAYGALPAIPSKNAAWENAKKTQFPFVTTDSWNMLLAGMNYPDSPSAEGFMPNINEAWSRLGDFSNDLAGTSGLSLINVESELETDLTSIFNTQYWLISGKTNVSGATLGYHDGSDKTANAYHDDGIYAFPVSNGWSGTVTPSATNFFFSPASLDYTSVISDTPDQNYSAWPLLYLPLIMR